MIQVLFSMWQHQELREVYRKTGWKEADFVTKTVAARSLTIDIRVCMKTSIYVQIYRDDTCNRRDILQSSFTKELFPWKSVTFSRLFEKSNFPF